MKRKTKIYLSTLLISALTLTVFLTVGFYYLGVSTKTANSVTEKVPYRNVPENVSILFSFNDNSTLYYFDFSNSTLEVYCNKPIERALKNGIIITDYLNSNNAFLIDLIDKSGGIEYEINGELLRLTGTQALDYYVRGVIEQKELIFKICDNIAKYGLSFDEISSLISGNDTSLSYEEIMLWSDFLPTVSENIVFIS